VIAVDTNVLVRYLVEDDVAQADRVEAVLRRGAVLVPNTVLLETAWVLGTGYRFNRAAIADGITKLFGLDGVQPEDRATIRQALAWYAQGLDFADALHLASSGRADTFVTFDRALQRRARSLAGTIPVVAP
jgi:predicted nucleic-acid-binding protein